MGLIRPHIQTKIKGLRMLNLLENRNRLIKNAIQSIKRTALLEAEIPEAIQDFEYEPSDIINALFESGDSKAEIKPDSGFKNRKLTEKRSGSESESETKLTFFPNSSKYIKKRESNENQSKTE